MARDLSMAYPLLLNFFQHEFAIKNLRIVWEGAVFVLERHIVFRAVSDNDDPDT
jgi:hypothetical protein